MAFKKKKPQPPDELAQRMLDAVLDNTSGDVRAEGVEPAHTAVKLLLNEDRRQVVAWYRSNVSLLMKTMGIEPTPCRYGCGQEIWFVETKNGKAAPISRDGLNHWADCPKAPKRGKS